MSADPYRAFSVGYATQRRPDPRIDAHISRALAGAATVVDVGAGAGSYEPSGRTVLAVDPSATMLAQRPWGAAPAVRATAEALPLPDHAVDAALAVLTVHHWTDPAAGIAELVRVSDRQVVLTWDPPTFARSLWLVADYLPIIGEQDAQLACLDTVTTHLARHHDHVDVAPIPIPGDCTDGFLGAYWRRPYAYLDPAVRASMPTLAALPEQILEPAMHRLADDLASGRWHRRHGQPAGHDQHRPRLPPHHNAKLHELRRLIEGGAVVTT